MSSLENMSSQILVILPKEEFEKIKRNQEEILALLQQSNLQRVGGPRYAEHISAEEFMKECNIKRWKFDQLIAGNKIRTIKKKRKIYVPISEVVRYFSDPDIQ